MPVGLNFGLIVKKMTHCFKNEGGQEAGKCSKMVSDRGDAFLFVFFMLSSSLESISVSAS